MNNEWQPISTAPKDGTYILFGDNRFDKPAYLHAAWDKDLKLWATKILRSGGFAYWKDASHWMPIPKLPEQQPTTTATED